MLQTHRPVMRPMTTAHLAQTMTLLSLSADELKQQIESELASNPALEMTDERRCPNCQRPLPGNSPNRVSGFHQANGARGTLARSPSMKQ